MILRSAKAVVPLAVASLIPLPAQADVLEIGPGGEAQWIAGPVSEPATEENLNSAFIGTDAIDPALAVPAPYAAKIAELAARFDLSPALLEAVVWQESRWRANALSP